MASVIKNQELNQEEQLPCRGFLLRGGDKGVTAYLDSESSEELHIGDFVALDLTSKMKGLVVKKSTSTDKSLGIITNNLVSDTFSNKTENTVFTVSRIDSGVLVYVEVSEAIKRGDSLELDSSERLHRIKKKTGTGKQVGIALEDASSKGDLLLVSLCSS